MKLQPRTEAALLLLGMWLPWVVGILAANHNALRGSVYFELIITRWVILSSFFCGVMVVRRHLDK